MSEKQTKRKTGKRKTAKGRRGLTRTGTDGRANQKRPTSQKRDDNKTPRWPGKCPDCGGKLEVYSKNTDFQIGRRTKYIRCVNWKYCDFRTSSVERISGRRPAVQDPAIADAESE